MKVQPIINIWGRNWELSYIFFKYIIIYVPIQLLDWLNPVPTNNINLYISETTLHKCCFIHLLSCPFQNGLEDNQKNVKSKPNTINYLSLTYFVFFGIFLSVMSLFVIAVNIFKELQTRTLVKVLGFAGTLAVLIVVISSCSSRADAQNDDPKVTKKGENRFILSFFLYVSLFPSQSSSTSPLEEQQLEGLRLDCLETSCPELWRTLPRWPPGPSLRDTKAAPSIESSRTSCSRVETSPEETGNLILLCWIRVYDLFL